MVDVLAEVDQHLSTPSVDEILINGAHAMLVASDSGSELLASPFASDEEMNQWLKEFAFDQGVRLDDLYPANGGSIGHQHTRWHAVLSPTASKGPVLSVRKHRFANLSLSDFQMTREDREIVAQALHARRGVLIVGATGSGKTSLMAALLAAHCHDERIVCLETVEELPRINAASVALSTRPPNSDGHGAVSCEDLLPHALRLRPDRLVVGEIRTEAEASVFLAAGSTGHASVVATVHAYSLEDLYLRFPQLRQTSMTLLVERGSPPTVTNLCVSVD